MDDRSVITEKRQKFRDILFELSRNQEVLKSPEERKSYYQKFNELYYMGEGVPNFRHYYSDIFSVLLVLEDDPQADIDTLGQNIAYLAQNYDPRVSDAQNNINVRDELQKLYDHVSLDIARINYSKRGDDKLGQEESIQALTKQAEDSKEQYRKLVGELAATKDSLNKAQKEYIAILGIFASIVLAFVGGLTFSTSVFNNVHSVSIYKLVFVSLVIGLVFITIIYFLFHYVGVLTNRWGANDKSYEALIISYIAIAVLMVGVVVSWWFGIVEHRNENLEKTDNYVYESLSETTAEITVSDTDE